MNTNEKFDDVLNDALAEYREAEPLAGLEDRVLRRVHQSRQRRSLWRWSFAAAVTLAVVMIAFAAWLGLRQPKYKPLVTESASVDPQRFSPAVTASTKPNIADLLKRADGFGPETLFRPPAKLKPVPASRHTSLASDAQPQHPEFPDPTPLTSEERAVLAWARTDPQTLQTPPHDEDNAQALQASPQDEKEIAIAPLEIKPLADPDAGSKGDN